ncbi:MAG TPA: hypothetical protein VK137_08690, partial [Planctomycetaceae bacterium]|nr:hypothetical protein [Planctomycetaceae bacterium]
MATIVRRSFLDIVIRQSPFMIHFGCGRISVDEYRLVGEVFGRSMAQHLVSHRLVKSRVCKSLLIGIDKHRLVIDIGRSLIDGLL